MKKILYCASTIEHIRNFHIPYLKVFYDKGYEVWVLANKTEPMPYTEHVVAFPFHKSFISITNIKTIFTVRKLIKEHDFDIVSTHTTLASTIVRVGIKLLRRRPEVFHTCHGYLFHEKDGLRKWLYLLPEKICASVTNNVMVMNHEDYEIATKHKLYKGNLYYINGMGIDLSKFYPASQNEKKLQRMTYGYSENDFLLVYAAEFSKRKNQELLIRAFANVCGKMPNAKLLLAGSGTLFENCKKLAHKLHISKQTHFLGYVEDMRRLYIMCDVSVTTSRIEGLPFNVMESMACGLPVIASDIKGHRELVESGKTGILFNSQDGDTTELENALLMLYSYQNKRETFCKEGIEKVKAYALQNVKGQIEQIYAINDRGNL
ncbi:glycosyltransferase family 4 protein [Caproiciproducens galactitolivorans]|uniref:Putative glycosyltransferase EpsD n=1 Tax=Caproiciproducens galactitolivorans TaxID=642589 RepID=A0A4Z0XWX6_9FIRM|nr:glycosyltransferase family 4 protein [Caproiciproducens galactitolivorans]QEY34762.1 glycosyltransferase family 4 protein [Caproiciproducens galactitolivorans]TGJ75989.1 putative glycosyltransferase EpsD [Caproiciproducens galactitolivorans]